MGGVDGAPLEDGVLFIVYILSFFAILHVLTARILCFLAEFQIGRGMFYLLVYTSKKYLLIIFIT